MASREYIDDDEDDLPEASDLGRSRPAVDDVEDDEERDSEEEEDDEDEEEEEDEEQDSGRQRKRVKVSLLISNSLFMLKCYLSAHPNDPKHTVSSISKSKSTTMTKTWMTMTMSSTRMASKMLLLYRAILIMAPKFSPGVY
jgi:TATA-binding protein-associated factor Taf7